MATLPTLPKSNTAPVEVAGRSYAVNKDKMMLLAEKLLIDFRNPDLREKTLHEMSKKTEMFQKLAPLLWNSFGTVAALLQEIVSIYPALSPNSLTSAQSTRVCNALTLLQSVASHPATRIPFLNAQIPQYLYPFIYTSCKSRPFEYLRLSSLGIIGALVKVDDTEVVGFLLSTEIIPLCLRAMDVGTELSKTLATFIMRKILLNDFGLGYVCIEADRFHAVNNALRNMVTMQFEQPSARLLMHIIRCYFRLSDHESARVLLKKCMPHMLMDGTLNGFLHDDPSTLRYLQLLVLKVHSL